MARQILIVDLVHLFLANQKSELAPSSYKWYANYLLPLARKHGPLAVSKITPTLIDRWAAAWPDASQHSAARTVVRVCNWGVAQHLLTASPLRGYRKPSPTRRGHTLTPAQYVLCVKHSRGPLRDVVKFLYHTGCRPQELRAIERRWITGQKIVFPLSKSKGGKKRRVVYLDGMACAIITRLARQNHTGPLFRNSHGHRWTKNSLGLAFQRLRRRAGIIKLCAYQFRHSYITRLLERGVDVATVAAVSGNSPAMVLDVYNHVAANENRLLAIIRGAG